MPLRLLLLAHVRFMLVVNEFDDRQPGVTIVDIVTKTRGVNDSELDLELTFLKLGLDYFNLGELVELFVVTFIVVFRGRQFSGKEGVDQGCFTQTRLACPDFISELAFT